MRIQIKKFGDVLTSRQAGREALAAFLPSLGQIPEGETVMVDFGGINVLSPSWADEFLTPLMARFGHRLTLEPSDNPSVKLTIETLEQILGKKFA